ERQRRILALHYDDELSLNAISRRLQISPQRVSQLHLSALARLRRAPLAR
ncbi:MAG: sigma factor-like helix-turn-helix DNA-binding protein, partial [Vulcanimicrobiaceae bacterium]